MWRPITSQKVVVVIFNSRDNLGSNFLGYLVRCCIFCANVELVLFIALVLDVRCAFCCQTIYFQIRFSLTVVLNADYNEIIINMFTEPHTAILRNSVQWLWWRVGVLSLVSRQGWRYLSL